MEVHTICSATTLPKLGLDVKFVERVILRISGQAITEKTKALFAETIGNPKGNVLDIEAVAAIAHETWNSFDRG